uniref:Reverse transcriptase n=1 Tax=Peronospora matthiolae TaxID=2874970 RepID=A0AAV1T816_9STRA
MRDGEFQGQADQLVEDCKVVKIDTPADDEIVRPPTGIDVIETGYESDRGRDRPRQTGQKSGDIEDNRYEVTDPVHKQSSRQPDRIKSEDCELQDQVDKRTKKMDCTKTDEETTKDELTPSPMYHHDAGELFAEDVDQHLAVLPEVVTPTQDITIDDIQVGDPGIPITEDQEKLRQMIWKSRHLLIGKGNALPPAARGAVCDIDVGGASPIAQRVRPVAPKFREKLADLIKGLLSDKIIRPSTSPWASPIVVIIKKNGEDIRLCIDYRRVN